LHNSTLLSTGKVALDAVAAECDRVVSSNVTPYDTTLMWDSLVSGLLAGGDFASTYESASCHGVHCLSACDQLCTLLEPVILEAQLIAGIYPVYQDDRLTASHAAIILRLADKPGFLVIDPGALFVRTWVVYSDCESRMETSAVSYHCVLAESITSRAFHKFRQSVNQFKLHAFDTGKKKQQAQQRLSIVRSWLSEYSVPAHLSSPHFVCTKERMDEKGVLKQNKWTFNTNDPISTRERQDIALYLFALPSFTYSDPLDGFFVRIHFEHAEPAVEVGFYFPTPVASLKDKMFSLSSEHWSQFKEYLSYMDRAPLIERIERLASRINLVQQARLAAQTLIKSRLA